MPDRSIKGPLDRAAHLLEEGQDDGEILSELPLAFVYRASMAGRVGEWSEGVARQSAAGAQRRGALLPRVADTGGSAVKDAV